MGEKSTFGDVQPSPEERIDVKIFNKRHLVYSTCLKGPVEIGRQRQGEPGPPCHVPLQQRDRIIIAALNEDTISRQQLHLDLSDSAAVRVSNRSKNRTIMLEPGGQLAPGAGRDVSLPVLLIVGEKVIRLQRPHEDDSEVLSLPEPTPSPGESVESQASLENVISSSRSGDAMLLVRWLRSTMDVFQSAVGSEKFLPQAARAVADLVELDCAAALSCDRGNWRVEALHSRTGVVDLQGWEPSQTILERVRSDHRTFRSIPSGVSSLQGVQSLVAAPILDSRKGVIGALYGERRMGVDTNQGPVISELEAMLVELLACAVSAGMARLDQQRAAIAARANFEQFFTPQLAQQLALHPELLSGKDAEITVLFCDIRRFSQISELLGPERTLALINAALGAFSDCVIENHGVLVDYVGDELMALWGAPGVRTDHAQLACQAAIQMWQQLPKINEQWSADLNEPISVGIGLNTGIARVGNTGSHRKFKYGPLGNTVNLASRVRNATRHAKANILITESTADALPPDYPTRRLCNVRFRNISEVVTLFELASETSEVWLTLKKEYEAALQAFEAADFITATRILGNLIRVYPHDGPTLVLLSRSVSELAESTNRPFNARRSYVFNPVWDLEEK